MVGAAQLVCPQPFAAAIGGTESGDRDLSRKVNDMSEDETRNAELPGGVSGNGPGRMFVHRIVRYAPSPLRDEWVNIGVLLFDPKTGDGRLRLIEGEEEYKRLRRLHPQADESLLRALRDDLESRFETAALTKGRGTNGNGGSQYGRYLAGQGERPGAGGWLRVLEKWDQTLSSALRLADPKATRADDLDSELARLYDDRVAVPPRPARAGWLTSRSDLRSC
jgi:hypothetical protein